MAYRLHESAYVTATNAQLPPAPNRYSRRLPWWLRHGLWVVAVCVALVLAAIAWTVRTRVQNASLALTHAQADSFFSGLRGFVRSSEPDGEDLAHFLDEQSEAGLRYIAIVDADGAPMFKAGTERGSRLEPGTFVPVADRFRVVRPVPPRVARTLGIRPGGGRPRAVVVIEFEPLLSRRLQADTRVLSLVSLVAAALVVLLGLLASHAFGTRARLQADVERNQRLATVGEMVAVLSHEIRNPLASLKGHAQLLVEQLASGSREKTKAEIVVSEAERLEHLTNELLAFLSQGTLERQLVDPRALTQAAANDIRDGVVEFEFEQTVGSIRADEALLRQALANVIRNATQASPRDKPVVVSVHRKGSFVVFGVRDFGAGIAEVDREHIFEPFFTKRTRGTGLGLTITRRIVEMHDGTIELHHPPGGGARFELTLPIQPIDDRREMHGASSGGR